MSPGTRRPSTASYSDAERSQVRTGVAGRTPALAAKGRYASRSPLPPALLGCELAPHAAPLPDPGLARRAGLRHRPAPGERRLHDPAPESAAVLRAGRPPGGAEAVPRR